MRRVRQSLATLGVAIGILSASATAQQSISTDELINTLQRVGERVERFFLRAQSIV